MRKLWHLTKRFVLALDRRQISAATEDTVRQVLLAKEFELWCRMPLIDQKHSILVMRRFVVRAPQTEVSAIRAALLHDVGKTSSNLGILERVFASIIGYRIKKYQTYHDHEAGGAMMLREIGSDEATCRLVSGAIVDGDDNASVLRALRDADNI